MRVLRPPPRIEGTEHPIRMLSRVDDIYINKEAGGGGALAACRSLEQCSQIWLTFWAYGTMPSIGSVGSVTFGNACGVMSIKNPSTLPVLIADCNDATQAFRMDGLEWLYL